MRAIRVHTLGGPEVLTYEAVEDPRPGPGEALVRVQAAGVNFLDIYYRSGFHWGGHHGRDLPYIPGAEGAGVVAAVGEGVTHVAPGDRVAYGVSNGAGAYAELQALPAWHLTRLPDGIDAETAGAAMQQGMTAHYLCSDVFPLAPGHVCLVHAAAGGTGLMLVQMAKLRGARVIGTVSTAGKAAYAREAGADAVIVTGEADFQAETRRLTDGAGVHVVYDSIGAATFEASLACLRPKGMMALYGQSSGRVPPFDTAILNAMGSLFLARPSLTHYVACHADVERRAGDMFRWIAEGCLTVHVGGRFALRDAAQAHIALESRATTGKLLLIP